MTEIIIFICTVVCTLVAIGTYKRNYYKKPTEEIMNLVNKYTFAKELNERVLQKLIAYASSNNAYQEHFMQGITFRKGINLLQEAKNEIFTNDDVMKNLERLKAYGRMVKIYLIHSIIILNIFAKFKLISISTLNPKIIE